MIKHSLKRWTTAAGSFAAITASSNMHVPAAVRASADMAAVAVLVLPLPALLKLNLMAECPGHARKLDSLGQTITYSTPLNLHIPRTQHLGACPPQASALPVHADRTSRTLWESRRTFMVCKPS